MNIMLHYIQFTVYLVISTELNLGLIKERMIIMELLIIPHSKVYMMTIACSNSLKMFFIVFVLKSA